MAEVQFSTILPGDQPTVSRPPQTDFEKLVDRILKRLPLPEGYRGGGYAAPAPGQSPEATARAEEAIRRQREEAVTPPDPNWPTWCFGIERTLCKDAKLFGFDASGSCEAAANVSCLAVGVFVLLALLGLSLNALLRG